nr:hypothetical protein CFP56_34939 [Quercus suber]
MVFAWPPCADHTFAPLLALTVPKPVRAYTFHILRSFSKRSLQVDVWLTSVAGIRKLYQTEASSGRSDYPCEYPLRARLSQAKSCSIFLCYLAYHTHLYDSLSDAVEYICIVKSKLAGNDPVSQEAFMACAWKSIDVDGRHCTLICSTLVVVAPVPSRSPSRTRIAIYVGSWLREDPPMGGFNSDTCAKEICQIAMIGCFETSSLRRSFLEATSQRLVFDLVLFSISTRYRSSKCLDFHIMMWTSAWAISSDIYSSADISSSIAAEVYITTRKDERIATVR